jgi:hypothetical protein
VTACVELSELGLRVRERHEQSGRTSVLAQCVVVKGASALQEFLNLAREMLQERSTAHRVDLPGVPLRKGVWRRRAAMSSCC